MRLWVRVPVAPVAVWEKTAAVEIVVPHELIVGESTA